MEKLVLRPSLFGKHPSSSEYLFFGCNSKMMLGVAKWIESGYEAMLRNKITPKTQKVNHFCFIDKENNSFICGSIKLHRDSNNREFPLVIAVEVLPYSHFKISQNVVEFTKHINKKILKIFQEKYTLDELKQKLMELSNVDYISVDVGKNEDFLAMFMSEDFSWVDILSKPLKISDFARIMR